MNENKTVIDVVDVVDEVTDRVGWSLGHFYDKALMESMTKQTPFNTLSDVEVEEIVPRFYVRVPKFYIHKNYEYENEWSFGFNWESIFTIGKKKQKRFLYTWELPKDKQKDSVIKFKRYGDLKASYKDLDETD